MMICCCALAGTQACNNCPRYKEYFGEQIKNINVFEKDKYWRKEEVKKAIAELIETEFYNVYCENCAYRLNNSKKEDTLYVTHD